MSDYHERLVKRQLQNSENVLWESEKYRGIEPDHMTPLNVILADQILSFILLCEKVATYYSLKYKPTFLKLCSCLLG